VSWGEDKRTDYQAEWHALRKCYYCSELKETKLTELDGGVVCKQCLHTIAEHKCPFCGEWHRNDYIAKEKVDGQKICYKCYSRIPK